MGRWGWANLGVGDSQLKGTDYPVEGATNTQQLGNCRLTGYPVCWDCLDRSDDGRLPGVLGTA